MSIINAGVTHVWVGTSVCKKLSNDDICCVDSCVIGPLKSFQITRVKRKKEKKKAQEDKTERL